MQRWIIFDLDGTLIESEEVWRDVRRGYVVSQGGHWHAGAQTAMIGMRTAEWARYIHDELGVSLASDEIAHGVIERMLHRIASHVPVLPGASEALERLSAAYPLALATAASRAVTDAVLAKTGWNAVFEVVVSADEVNRGKPAPDVYLRALELTKADPRSAAIEDSANGIRSGHAAGLAVVAIPNHAFPPDPQSLALAARVLPSLAALDVAVIDALFA